MYICILTAIIFWKKNKERKDGNVVNVARLVELKIIITVIFFLRIFRKNESVYEIMYVLVLILLLHKNENLSPVWNFLFKIDAICFTQNWIMCSFSWIFAKFQLALDFIEFVHGSFSCFNIEIAYSNFTFTFKFWIHLSHGLEC